MPGGTVSWSIRKLHPGFGAELSGHEITPLLGQGLRDEVLHAVHRFGVVVIPQQDLPDTMLHDFAASIGKVHEPRALAYGSSGVSRLTNLGEDGNILPPKAKTVRVNDANELWHTDSTYLRPRAAISVLHARVIPPAGGNAEFCDTRCAYENLDAVLRAELSGLVASHSLIHSRALTGFSDWTDEERLGLVPVDRPLVHRHEESGRMALCLAAHIAGIKPLTEDRAELLLQLLTEAATAPDCVYAHHWHVGDLLLWDNRCTMHRARPYEQMRYGRDMRTIRLDDEADV
jgi:alpha-ketoglutarate-dependent 2,4-dichlorophenoxyacetate dioxygenase